MNPNKMTIEQKLETLNVTPDQITLNTYVWVDEDMAIHVSEKSDRQAYYVDEIQGEYVTAYGTLTEMRKYYSQFLTKNA